jgi:hypothetical protein
VTLRSALGSLDDGDTVGEILADFPSLKPEDIRAVIAFAPASAEGDLPYPSCPPDSIRIKVDENPPLQTSSRLKTLGHDVHATLEEGLSGFADREIWDAAQRKQRSCCQTIIYGFMEGSTKRGCKHKLTRINQSSPSCDWD